MNAAFGPSGCEEEIAAVIAKMAKPYCDEITTDVMGNLICRKKGPGKKIMFAAHMDSIGIMVTFIDDKGFARCVHLGGMQLLPMIALVVLDYFINGTKYSPVQWVAAFVMLFAIIMLNATGKEKE